MHGTISWSSPQGVPFVFCFGARRAIIVDSNEQRRHEYVCRCLRCERRDNCLNNVDMQRAISTVGSDGHHVTATFN
jgi:hypothetical protein